MPIINLDTKRITPEQYELLIPVLRECAKQYTPLKSAFLARGGVTVYLKNAVHFNPMDQDGPFHFDIQIGTNGANSPTMHVYVVPALDVRGAMGSDNRGTVYMNPATDYWVWDGLTVGGGLPP